MQQKMNVILHHANAFSYGMLYFLSYLLRNFMRGIIYQYVMIKNEKSMKILDMSVYAW